jgi:hypothetical protein
LLSRSVQKVAQQAGSVPVHGKPQSIVWPQLSTTLPHRPLAHVLPGPSGAQQAPTLSQTSLALAQQVAPQALPLAQQTPAPPEAFVQVVPEQQSVALSQGSFSLLHAA